MTHRDPGDETQAEPAADYLITGSHSLAGWDGRLGESKLVDWGFSADDNLLPASALHANFVTGTASGDTGRLLAGRAEPQKLSFTDWVNSDSEQLLELITALERAHLPLGDQALGANGLFGYIALNPIEFLAGLRLAAEHLPTNQRRFLDVGCGIGSKLLLARRLGWQAFGLEIRAEYAAVARRLLPGAMIAECDAGEYPDFEAFDLLYAYRPAHDDTLMIGLEQRMIKAMRSGALLWLPGPRGEIELEPVGHLLWRKP